MQHAVPLPSASVAIRASLGSGAMLALATVCAFAGLIACGLVPAHPPEPGPTTAAVGGALGLVAPVLVPLAFLGGCRMHVLEARAASPTLGAAVLAQQVRGALLAAAGLAALAAALGAGVSLLPAALLAVLAAAAVSRHARGAAERAEAAVLRRWGAAPTGPLRLVLAVQGTAAELRDALRRAAEALPQDEPAQPRPG